MSEWRVDRDDNRVITDGDESYFVLSPGHMTRFCDYVNALRVAHDYLAGEVVKADKRAELFGRENQTFAQIEEVIDNLRRDLFIAHDGLNDCKQENERLQTALEDLYAEQNGPPLPTYEDSWNAAMTKARDILGYQQPTEAKQ